MTATNLRARLGAIEALTLNYESTELARTLAFTPDVTLASDVESTTVGIALDLISRGVRFLPERDELLAIARAALDEADTQYGHTEQWARRCAQYEKDIRKLLDAAPTPSPRAQLDAIEAEILDWASAELDCAEECERCWHKRSTALIAIARAALDSA